MPDPTELCVYIYIFVLFKSLFSRDSKTPVRLKRRVRYMYRPLIARALAAFIVVEYCSYILTTTTIFSQLIKAKPSGPEFPFGFKCS